MFCPNCKTEYRPGFSVCIDCDAQLVDSLEQVREEARLEPLRSTASPEELGELLEGLERAGVPYVVQAGTALALLQGERLREEGEPDPWQAGIAVLSSFRERADRVVERVRRARREGSALLGRPPEDP